MNAVFFEVSNDQTTKAAHQARRKVLTGMAASPEHDLFGSDAMPSDVKKAHSKSTKFDLFSGMGHGGPDEFEWLSTSNLYDTNDSASANYTLRGTIVHLYSCNCAQTLGPHLVRMGAKAFIGYESPISVSNTQTIEEEYVKVAAAIDRSILNGDSSATTKSKADNEFAVVNTRLLASPTATPRDVAQFRINHRSLVGPWTNTKFGSY